MNKASETCGTVTGVTIAGVSEEKEEKVEGAEIFFSKNNVWKFPKFGKRHKPTDLRSWENPKQLIYLKNSMPRHMIFKLWKNKDKVFKQQEKWDLN